jgi:hypothetical protein
MRSDTRCFAAAIFSAALWPGFKKLLRFLKGRFGLRVSPPL